MKRILQTVLIVLISITTFSQTLDASFGTNGKVITPIGIYQDAITSMALQTDGKIVACGVSRELGDFYRTIVCRYNDDGSLDTSFGNNGKVALNYLFDHGDKSHLKLQTDGKILIATNEGAYQELYNFLLVRLNSDGSYDTGFGNNGVVITDFEMLGNSENVANAIELQADNKIILAGENSANTGGNTQFENFAIVRYNSNGSIDTTYGDEGRVEFNIGSNSINQYSIDGINSIKLQSDGKLVVGGYSDAQSIVETYNFCLVRLNTDGSLDTTFGTNGKVITDFEGSESTTTLIVTNTGIIAGGIIYFNSNINSAIVLSKYDLNGNLDVTFGNNGKVITQINTTNLSNTILEMVLQTDNKIVAVGYSLNDTIDFLLLRYNVNGNLDTSFDDDGILTTDFNSTADGAYTVLIQPDSKIVAGGLSGVSPNYEFALARYTLEDLALSNFDTTTFKIYPNPATTVLYIVNDLNGDIQNVAVVDMLGKRVLKKINTANQVDVDDLQSGIYFLEFEVDGQKQVVKFIKL